IHVFTQRVLNTAIGQIAAWQRTGQQVRVSVNISVNNLLDQGFVDTLAESLAAANVPAELLELEVTESAVMRHPDTIMKRLYSIRSLGVRLAIDDFGTGYASLAYLKQLPVQLLKVDKSFILQLATDPADQRIVRSAIQLAHGFGMQVCAEGVETEATAAMLRDYGCDHAQGYHFSRPVPAHEIERTYFEAARPVAAVVLTERRLS
ncbi:MAG TPA: EAL domain-containing protein, partial [Steroidobacteraceae bacterium]|nr:EAL domain-containing protein [Steroidobacteraceae bacterium]